MAPAGKIPSENNDRMDHEIYTLPLVSRYASAEMSRLWGDRRRIRTWRQLWLALAEAQHELGLPIRDQQLGEMRANIDRIDFQAALEYEKRLRHDVMAHVHAFGDVCPSARPIIHWGATSCYVTDNTDLILMREGLTLIRDRLVAVIDALGHFAEQHADLACLALTHLQPAQPTTLGKRACLWCQDLVLDLSELNHRIDQLRARGVKGTTGTQASFLQLFDGDAQKVEALERRVAEKIGFHESYSVTGQTYPRKVDAQILDTLAGIAQSAHKAATDIRLLIGRQELDEPLEPDQVGSSAMAFKRNPMRSERICALARFVMNLPANAAQTAATQWLERSLDDSANRRLVLPQAFLATDALLILYHNVVRGLVVYPSVIARNLNEPLPFLATERILMAAVAAGGDRQVLHERIRQHSLAAARRVKEEGAANDLLDRLAKDPAFAGCELAQVLDPSQFVGLAPQQVRTFLRDEVEPIRKRYAPAAEMSAGVRV